jgi:hypothetical protein
MPMPRYYFDVLLDTGLTIDHIGTDLPDMTTAGREASGLLVDLAREQHRDGRSSNISVTVRSEDNTPCLAGTISVEMKTLPECSETQAD